MNPVGFMLGPNWGDDVGLFAQLLSRSTCGRLRKEDHLRVYFCQSWWYRMILAHEPCAKEMCFFFVLNNQFAVHPWNISRYKNTHLSQPPNFGTGWQHLSDLMSHQIWTCKACNLVGPLPSQKCRKHWGMVGQCQCEMTPLKMHYHHRFNHHHYWQSSSSH